MLLLKRKPVILNKYDFICTTSFKTVSSLILPCHLKIGVNSSESRIGNFEFLPSFSFLRIGGLLSSFPLRECGLLLGDGSDGDMAEAAKAFFMIFIFGFGNWFCGVGGGFDRKYGCFNAYQKSLISMFLDSF